MKFRFHFHLFCNKISALNQWIIDGLFCNEINEFFPTGFLGNGSID